VTFYIQGSGTHDVVLTQSSAWLLPLCQPAFGKHVPGGRTIWTLVTPRPQSHVGKLTQSECLLAVHHSNGSALRLLCLAHAWSVKGLFGVVAARLRVVPSPVPRTLLHDCILSPRLVCWHLRHTLYITFWQIGLPAFRGEIVQLSEILNPLCLRSHGHVRLQRSGGGVAAAGGAGGCHRALRWPRRVLHLRRLSGAGLQGKSGSWSPQPLQDRHFL